MIDGLPPSLPLSLELPPPLKRWWTSYLFFPSERIISGMAERDPKKSIRPEAILGAFGVSSVRMDQIIIPGSNPQLHVIAERGESGLIVFSSMIHHEPRPENALFDGPVQPNNN